MNREERLARLDRMIEEQRIIRHKWSSVDSEGRALACFLVALVPEVAEQGAEACPADVLSPWMVHLTPWLDDHGSTDRWPTVLRRWQRIVHDWPKMSEQQTKLLRFACACEVVREARKHAHMDRALDLATKAYTLLDKASRGENPGLKAWCEVEGEARKLGGQDVRLGHALSNALGSEPRALCLAAGKTLEAAIATVRWGPSRPIAEISALLWETRVATEDRIIDSLLTVMERAIEAA